MKPSPNKNKANSRWKCSGSTGLVCQRHPGSWPVKHVSLCTVRNEQSQCKKEKDSENKWTAIIYN